jgi:hypothetical protein
METRIMAVAPFIGTSYTTQEVVSTDVLPIARSDQLPAGQHALDAPCQGVDLVGIEDLAKSNKVRRAGDLCERLPLGRHQRTAPLRVALSEEDRLVEQITSPRKRETVVDEPKPTGLRIPAELGHVSILLRDQSIKERCGVVDRRVVERRRIQGYTGLFTR